MTLMTRFAVCNLKVCGQSLRNVTHEMAIQTLRQTPPVIKLVILREETDVLSDAKVFDTVVVNLVKKPGQGLGFSIIGRSSGVFISEVVRAHSSLYTKFINCYCYFCQ